MKKKTVNIKFENIKSDTWFDGLEQLGKSHPEIYRILKDAETANFELELDENLNLKGKIIPKTEDWRD